MTSLISEKPLDILTCLDQNYILKPGSIGRPTQYLGSQVGQYWLPVEPEKIRWSFSSEKYAKEAIRNVQNWLLQHEFPQLKKTTTALPSGYRPALVATEYCNGELHQFYQHQIGVL
jgi:hypothetical protein